MARELKENNRKVDYAEIGERGMWKYFSEWVRICEDICVSCECSGKTASAGEGVTGREQQGGSGEGGLSSGHQSPEPPCPYLLDSLMKWPGWEG